MIEAKINYLDVHVSFLIFLHFNFYLISFIYFFTNPVITSPDSIQLDRIHSYLSYWS